MCDRLQVNPPYYVKLVELVPHPETTARVMDASHALMTKVKMTDYTILGLSVQRQQIEMRLKG